MTDLSLRQLEYFVAIADAGSVSEAARVLHMSQPPLSIQLKKLEEQAGTALFTSHSHRLLLTDAGLVLYKRAKTMLELADTTMKEVQDAGRKETLSVGITPTTMTMAVSMLADFAKDKDIQLEIHDGSTFELMELLSRHVIQGAFVRTPVSTTSLHSLVLAKESMIAASAKDQGTRMTLRKAAGHPLILYRRYKDLILNAFHNENLNPEVFCVCDNARTAIELAAHTEAIAIIPESMRPDCSALHAAGISSPALKTDILFVYEYNDAQLFQKFVSGLSEFTEKR